jgi:predicted permease
MNGRLLHCLLDDASREAVIGDLEEGYAAVRRRRGALAAGWWYYTHAARSVIACRITAKRRQELRRLDFEPGTRPSLRDFVRPAFRQFRDQPLYALACCGTLALAVAAAAVSVVVIKRAFIEALPYRDAHELVSLLTVSSSGLPSAVSPHVLEDLRAGNPPLVEFAPIRPVGAAYVAAGSTENLRVLQVSPDYFTTLGVAPASGRVWGVRERDVVIISARFWRETLSRADVVGSSILIEGNLRTVVGIMPEDFSSPYFTATDAWLPLDMAALLADIRTRRTLTILARRAPATSQAELDAYLTVFSTQLQERFPDLHGDQRLIARPLRDELIGSSRSALIGTAAAAALLLVIVAANIAGLSTAQAVSSRQQLAVRAALGATRGRLFAEQLVDSVTLAVVGSTAGVILAYGLTGMVVRYQEFFLAQLRPITLDAPVIAISLATGISIGILAALLPRTVVSAAPADALRAARGASSDVKVTATRTGLVIAQVAIALVLLVGAGLLIRTVQHLSQRELGFDPDNLTYLNLNMPGRKFASRDVQIRFERDVVERLRQIPGVKAVMASVGFPLWGGMMAGLAIKGDAPGSPRREVAYLSLAPDFTRAVGARIIAGRDLLPSDTYDAPRVVVVNETMARMFWPQGDALGSEVQIGPGSAQEPWITVVGIMADMRAHGLTSDIRPTAFGSTWQYSWPRRHIAVRTQGAPPATLAADVKSAIHAVDPTVAIAAMTTAEQQLSVSMGRYRLTMFALTLFGGVALVLCVSGLYAVVALNSRQRRREYAIRVALGARRGGVRWMVVRQALVLTGVGATVGLISAALGTRALQGLLHGVHPIDPPTFAAAALGLLAFATLAAWQPAHQAENVNPVETLRAE